MARRIRFDAFKAIWGTIREPRALTAAFMSAYALAVIAGFIIVTDGVNAIATWVSVLCGGLLIVGGTLGIPSAWLGAWHVERGAAIAVTFGHLTGIIVTVEAHRNIGLVFFVLTPVLFMTGALMGIVRYIFAISNPYAPGKGPVLPENAVILEDELRLQDSKRRATEWADYYEAGYGSYDTKDPETQIKE